MTSASPEDSTAGTSSSFSTGAATSSTTGVVAESVSSLATTGVSTSSTTFSVDFSTTGVSLLWREKNIKKIYKKCFVLKSWIYLSWEWEL